MRKMVVVEQIEKKIYSIRGMRVMLDSDLSLLYGIETKQLKRAVKRNLPRFPNDFMIELTKQENDSLRCQFGTLKRGQHAKCIYRAGNRHAFERVKQRTSYSGEYRYYESVCQIKRSFTCT